MQGDCLLQDKNGNFWVSPITRVHFSLLLLLYFPSKKAVFGLRTGRPFILLFQTGNSHLRYQLLGQQQQPQLREREKAQTQSRKIKLKI